MKIQRHVRCLLTGASSGLGKAVALKMAKLGVHLILACRDERKGNEVIREIDLEIPKSDVELMLVDLASFASIKNLARQIKDRFGSLDILINNAATYVSKLRYTPDHIEQQFGVNYLGPFMLTNLLLGALNRSDSARIVNVTSNFHYYSRINFNDLFWEKKYNGIKAYNQSKLAIILFTYELSRLLNNTNITVNCVHPGGVKSDIGSKNASGFIKYSWMAIKPFLHSPERRAESLLYLAFSEEVEGVSGKYFELTKAKKSSKLSYDRETASQLWKVSERLTGLNFSEGGFE